jgi:hypothetical protein
MASATSYQNFSPRALEPYPIESKLSELAYSGYGNSPAEAQTALDQYWFERQAHENLYGQEVAAQHEEARQNLAAQMQGNRMKLLAEIKDPNVFSVIANSPEFRGNLGGISDEALAPILQRAIEGQRAQTFEKSGTGYGAFRHGGATLDLAQVPGGSAITNQGPTSDVQSAQINANARMAAAALHARSQMDQANQPGISVPLDKNLYGEGAALTGKLDPRADLEQQILRYRGLQTRLAQNGAEGTVTDLPPPAAVPKKTPMSPNTSGSASDVGKRLPPAQRDAGGSSGGPAGLPPGSIQLNSASKEGQAAQNRVIQQVDALKRNPDPTAQKIYNAVKLQGSTLHNTYKGSDGSLYVIGNDKQAYKVM